MLEALGLDEAHSAVYRAVLHLHAASAAEVAVATGTPVGQARMIFDELERRGLLARQASRADRVVASPPAMVLRPLLLEQERNLARAREAVADLSDLYRESAGHRNAADVVDVVLGPDALRQHISQLQAAATREVRVLVLSDVALMTSEENVEEERALLRGVRYRVIVEGGVLERPGYLSLAREAAGYGEEIRALPRLPTRMLIADDELALLPMSSLGERRASGGLLVHPSGLLDLVTAIFEEYWSAATEFLPEAETTRAQDGIDRDLLKLLLLGLTDAAVAAQLGISLRTVQRRISELLDIAGVSTRIQLGAEAVRRSWV
jgi:sugar-specific transcriptional regulator TrmB/DNA-binding CsgD family transcriptional regulator